MHGADQAGETVEAEPRAPVQVRLEEGESERTRRVEHQEAQQEPAQPRRRRDAPRPQARTLSYAEGREPDREDREAGAERDRDERDDDEARPARRGLELPRERARRGERVAEPARREHEHGDDREPEQPSHCTFSVNGAVSTRPPALNWRNSCHVPATGTRTATWSSPGFADVLATRGAPEKR